MSDRKKKTIKLPEECSKLSLNSCISEKVAGRCKIKRDLFGFKSKCVPNENYEVDKYLLDKNITNFAAIDTENFEKEVPLRNELCKQISISSCDSYKARRLGCEVRRDNFGIKKCALSKDLIDIFYRKKEKCLARDCPKKKLKYKFLCDEHEKEFEELIADYKELYNTIVVDKKQDDDSLFDFEDIYQYIKEVYPLYLIQKPKLNRDFEELYIKAGQELNKNQCQAYNITDCNTSKLKERCKRTGTETKAGLFCKTHLKCYKNRIQKFKYVRDNISRLCKDGGCNEDLKDLYELYYMIKGTTVGEASTKKNEINDYIVIIEEYGKL